MRDLTALGAPDAVATAELYVTDRRRWGAPPLHQPPSLSLTQHAALRAVAQGKVTIANGKPHLHRDGIRLSISTIRSLESAAWWPAPPARCCCTTSASTSPPMGAAA
ncbi:hypothetical protein [Streptomyces sp. CNQ-509]|uniref:hypothetical protein n=1 Tax=Streptomyces sp. CNQ-509 TaxID=444103 RepID=UPI00069BE0CB|nr:hypothetical protein [Streptomyces sp. CNQ-509]